MDRILAAAGLCAVGADGAQARVARAESAICWLWPENVPAWNMWIGLQTQWRADMGVRTGLDYAAVWAHLGGHGLGGRRARAVFESLQAMERVALREFADAAERNRYK